MGDPHDEVTIQEFFNKLTPDMLLSRLASRISIAEEEAQAIEARFDAFREWLLPVLGETVSAIGLYGSVTRRTCLIAPFDRLPDIDCLLVLEPNLFTERYVLSQPRGIRPELLWAEDIRACLRQSPEFDEKSFTFDPPYLSIRIGSDLFELTMSTGVPEAMEDPHAIYGIFGTMTEEERDARERERERFYGDSGEDDFLEDEEDDDDSDETDDEDDLDEIDEEEDDNPDRIMDYMGFERRPDEDIHWNYENTTESSDPLSSDGRLYGLHIMTQPFFYNGLVEQYSQLYGDYWRYLIVLWKYWLKSCDAPFRCYHIEDNVFRGLQYTAPFEAASDDGTIDFLHFVATYFGNRKLYDHKRFESDPSFCNFRDSLIRADDLFRTGSRVESLHVLSEIFEPWEPNWHGK